MKKFCKNVLIIDTNPLELISLFRRSMSSLIPQSSAFVIVGINSFVSAKDCLMKDNFDFVVLSDISSEKIGESAINLIPFIQQKSADAKIVLASNKDSIIDASRRRCLHYGFADKQIKIISKNIQEKKLDKDFSLIAMPKNPHKHDQNQTRKHHSIQH